MKDLQKTILEKGIENVKVQIINKTHWTPNINAICSLEKYWDNDDYSGYVHKIKVTDDTPIECNTVLGKELYIMTNSYYMCDLESMIRDNQARIL